MIKSSVQMFRFRIVHIKVVMTKYSHRFRQPFPPSNTDRCPSESIVIKTTKARRTKNKHTVNSHFYIRYFYQFSVNQGKRKTGNI